MPRRNQPRDRLGRFVSAASAAALGYIAAGPTGAQIGGSLGDWAYSSMPPVGSRKSQVKVIRSEGDATQTAFHLGSRKSRSFPKGFKALTAPRHVSTNAAGTQTSASGRQKAFLIPLTFDGTNTDVSLNGYYDSEMCFKNLLVDEPANASLVAGGAEADKTMRLWMESIISQITIKNQTQIPTEISIYDIVSRRDMSSNVDSSPYDRFNKGLFPESAFAQGDADLTADPGLYSTQIGATPFQSSNFCEFFHVKKVHKIVLHAGTEHIHNVHLKPRMALNRAVTSLLFQRRHVTYFCLVIMKGGIVSDSLALTQATLASAKLDYVIATRYEFRSLLKNRKVYSAYNQIPGLTGTGEAVVEDSDAIVAAVGTA